MAKQRDSSASAKTYDSTIPTALKIASKVDHMPRSFSKKAVKNIALQEQHFIGRRFAGDAALFVIKVAALETVRRFSRAKCPVVWNGLQALQVICFPPFKWIQRWSPFKGLGKGMKMLSWPLLLLSVASSFCDHSQQSDDSRDSNNSTRNQHAEDSESSALQLSEASAMPLQLSECRRTGERAPDHLGSETWMLNLYQELDKEGIIIPKRINEKELFRFYDAANHDFSCFLSSIKKTIYWRETYKLLTEAELDKWSKLVFWHGCDIKYQPCLIVRLGLACATLPNCERPRFVQAIVSQVEQGILCLVDEENPQIAVLVDCEGLSPLKVPMQTLKYCSSLLQDHFPNRLGCLFIIRLPSVVRMITQTFTKVLKPITRQKLKFIREPYKEILSEYLQVLPAYLGGNCICMICSEAYQMRHTRLTQSSNEIQLFSDMSDGDEMPPLETSSQICLNMFPDAEQVIRRVIVAVLMFWTFLALIAGVYDY